MPFLAAAVPAISAIGALGAGAAGVGSLINQANQPSGKGAPVDPNQLQPQYRDPAQVAAQQKAASDALSQFNTGTHTLSDQDRQVLGLPADQKSLSTHQMYQMLQDAEAEAQTEAAQEQAMGLPPGSMGPAQQKLKAIQLNPTYIKGKAAEAAIKQANPTFTDQMTAEALSRSSGMNATADTLQNRAAPTIDQSGFNTFTDKAMADRNDQSTQLLSQLAQGQGPAADAARAQLQQGIDASNNQAMSMANSARGGAGALALGNRTALMQAAQNNQVGANQAEMLRANMSMQGIQGLAAQRGENMSQDTNILGQRAGFATSNASNYLGNNQINDAAAANARNMGKQYFDTGIGLPQKNVENYLGGVNASTGQTNANTGANRQSSDATQGAVNTILGGATGLAQAVAMYGGKMDTSDGVGTPPKKKQ